MVGAGRLPTIAVMSKKGFTLIELIIAMAILAIVTGSLLGSFTKSQARARDAQRKSDLKQIQNALEAYANDHNGTYPKGDSNGNILGCPADTETACDWGDDDGFRMSGGAVYMTRMVKDPRNTKYYYVSSDNTSYQIYACLENDKDLCFDSSPNCNELGFSASISNPCGQCWSNNLCNYGVSSANTTP